MLRYGSNDHRIVHPTDRQKPASRRRRCHPPCDLRPFHGHRGDTAQQLQHTERIKPLLYWPDSVRLPATRPAAARRRRGHVAVEEVEDRRNELDKPEPEVVDRRRGRSQRAVGHTAHDMGRSRLVSGRVGFDSETFR